MNDNYDYTGEKFLNRLYRDLNNSEEVNHVMSNGNKDEKVRSYLERLEKVEKLAKSSKYNGMELLKDLYYKKYVIKPENVPESYFELEKKIAFERGYGYINITEKIKQQMLNSLIEDQKKSLDIWLDYLIGDNDTYPEWFKYYAFQGMLKLGSYDKEKGQFNKRTDKTTNIFAELDREALSLTYDNLVNVLNGKKVDDEVLQKLLEAGSFSKIYGYLIKKLNSQKIEINGNEGIWIKYNQGTSPDELVKSLDGKRTRWCTAGYEKAKEQLIYGDFYVYYTKDTNGEYKQPRIAIRMEENKIGEIRGIAKQQNLEPEMEDILEEKLNEFPDKNRYKKKVNDMKKLTTIYNEYKNRELTVEELRFLYEVDDKILGFGYEKDPRVNEILMTRNFKRDLSHVFNCNEDEISNDIKDILNNKKIIWFHGNIDLLELTHIDKLNLPKIVDGNLDLRNLKTVEILKLPEVIKGYLDLSCLTTTKKFELPKTVEGYLDLSGLETVEELKLPKIINGSLYLDNLTIIERFVFPEKIDGDLSLRKLKKGKKIVFPKIIEGSLYLNNLTRAYDLQLPLKVNKQLYLNSLTSVKDLNLPSEVNGSIYLNNLASPENLKLPEKPVFNLSLSSLRTVKDLKLPKHVYGTLDLRVLTTVERLILPEFINDLWINNLDSIECIIIPENFHCNYIESNYGITIEDLIAKSLENKETEVKRMGFASTWILLVITYIISIIASLFIFIK